MEFGRPGASSGGLINEGETVASRIRTKSVVVKLGWAMLPGGFVRKLSVGDLTGEPHRQFRKQGEPRLNQKFSTGRQGKYCTSRNFLASCPTVRVPAWGRTNVEGVHDVPPGCWYGGR